jgi:ubiquinone/menaquinone biosynthesis C-methylase UbiE
MSPTDAIALLSPAPLNFAQPSRWADLGCGTGLFTLALATLLQPGSTIFAIDRQPKVRPQITPNQVRIEPVGIDFVKHPLNFHDLDGILMANSLHYVKDKATLIRTLRAANLRQKRAILIIEYDTDRSTPIWVTYPMSFKSLQNFAHIAGYSTITRLADHPSIYNRNKIYSAYIA